MKTVKVAGISGVVLQVDNKDYERVNMLKWRYIGKGTIIANIKKNNVWGTISIIKYLYPGNSIRFLRKDGDVFNVTSRNLVAVNDIPDSYTKDLLREKRDNFIECLDNAYKDSVSLKLSGKYRGVVPNRKEGSWHVKITHNRTVNYLGTFHNYDEAGKQYNAYAKSLFGKKAKLNVIGKPGELQ